MENTPTPAAGAAPLSLSTAFVVHLTGSAAEAARSLNGRVEHVTSGRSLRFTSLNQLLEFMQGTLWGTPADACAGESADKR